MKSVNNTNSIKSIEEVTRAEDVNLANMNYIFESVVELLSKNTKKIFLEKGSPSYRSGVI